MKIQFVIAIAVMKYLNMKLILWVFVKNVGSMLKKDYIKREAEKVDMTVQQFKAALKKTGQKVVICKCGHACCRGYIIK